MRLALAEKTDVSLISVDKRSAENVDHNNIMIMYIIFSTIQSAAKIAPKFLCQYEINFTIRPKRIFRNKIYILKIIIYT